MKTIAITIINIVAINFLKKKKTLQMITMITGGARSGKSSYAQNLALQMSNAPIYVATARHWDDDFEKRIQRHKHDRDERWTLIEEEKMLSSLPLQNKTVLIDCITLWLTNFFTDNKNDVDACLQQCKTEIDALAAIQGNFIIVTNELGMGMHAQTEAGRRFCDLQGWMNQYIAAVADTVIFMVSGIPVTIKKQPQ